MPMAISEITTLIRNPTFLADMTGSAAVETYQQLAAAYQTHKLAGTLPPAQQPEDIALSAEIEWALGCLSKQIADEQTPQLAVGSVADKIAVLEASDNDFKLAIQYFTSAIQTCNPSTNPRFQTNNFRLQVGKELIAMHAMMMSRYKNLNLMESAVNACEQQIQAMQQLQNYLPVVANEERNRLQTNIKVLKGSSFKLKMTDALDQHANILTQMKAIKVNEKVIALRKLMSPTGTSAHLKNLAHDSVSKAMAFDSAAFTFILSMESLISLYRTGLKHNTTELLAENPAASMNLEQVSKAHAACQSETAILNAYLTEHATQERVSPDTIQTFDLTSELTQYQSLLEAAQKSFATITQLRAQCDVLVPAVMATPDNVERRNLLRR